MRYDTGLFYPLSNHQTQQSSQVPELDNWIGIKTDSRFVITGVVSNHPSYSDGQRIVVFSIQGFRASKDGSIYAFTRHSHFKLGQKLGVYKSDKTSDSQLERFWYQGNRPSVE